MDSISGGSIPTDGVVKLTIDSDKIGYIFLPDGTILTTDDGEIDTTYTGVGGTITYYVPKNNSELYISNSDITGNIVYNGVAILNCNYCASLTSLSAPLATYLECSSCASLTSLSAPIANILNCTDCASLTSLSAPIANNLECSSCSLLTSLSAPLANSLNCTDCALSAKSIGDILYQSYVDDREDVYFDFTGGTNALQSEVNSYLVATYGIAYASVVALLVTTNGGTILIDTV